AFRSAGLALNHFARRVRSLASSSFHSANSCWNSSPASAFASCFVASSFALASLSALAVAAAFLSSAAFSWAGTLDVAINIRAAAIHKRRNMSKLPSFGLERFFRKIGAVKRAMPAATVGWSIRAQRRAHPVNVSQAAGDREIGDSERDASRLAAILP